MAIGWSANEETEFKHKKGKERREGIGTCNNRIRIPPH
jgi:hypothetical protein